MKTVTLVTGHIYKKMYVTLEQEGIEEILMNNVVTGSTEEKHDSNHAVEEAFINICFHACFIERKEHI